MTVRFFDPNEDALIDKVVSAANRRQTYRMTVTPQQAAGVTTMARLYGTALPPGTIYSFGSAGVDPNGPEVQSAVRQRAKSSSWWDKVTDTVSGAVAAASDVAGDVGSGIFAGAKATSRGVWAGAMAAPQMFSASLRDDFNGRALAMGRGGAQFAQTDLGQMIAGKDSGSGFFVSGDAHDAQARAVYEAAPPIDGKPWTPGRALARSAAPALNNWYSVGGPRFGTKRPFDPGQVGYNVVSGLVDATINVGFDPTTYVGGRQIRGAVEARRSFAGSKTTRSVADLHDELGLINSPTRNTVIGEKAYNWLARESQGGKVTKWLAEQSDFNTIWKGTGKKLPVGLIHDLTNAKTQGEVIDALAPHLNVTVPGKFGVRLADQDVRIVSAAARVVRKKDSVRLLGLLPESNLYFADRDDAVEQLDRYLRNAKLDEATISGHNAALASAKSRAEVYEATTGAFESIRQRLLQNSAAKTKRQAAADRKLARDLTRIWGEHKAVASYWADELGVEQFTVPRLTLQGEVIETPQPHLWNELLNTSIPLPNLREIRRATGNRYLAATLDSKMGRATSTVLGAATQGVWIPLHLARIAFIQRNLSEAQLRMASAGLPNAFTHPMEWLSWVTGEKGGLDFKGEIFGPQRTSAALRQADYFIRSLNRNGGQYRAAGRDVIMSRTMVPVDKSDPDHYLDGWASRLSMLSNDPVARRVIAGDIGAGDATPGRGALTGMDLVKDWFHDGAGRKFRLDMEENDDFIAAIQRASGQPLEGKAASDWYIDSIEQRIQHLTSGDPELRELLDTGKINGISLWNGDDINPKILAELEQRIHLGPTRVVARDWVQASKNNPELQRVAEAWGKGVDFIFDWIASKPENAWNNSPVYRVSYWKAARHLIEEMDPKAQGKMLANAKRAGISKADLADLERAAKRGGGTLDLDTADQLAAREGLAAVKKLLYTNKDRTQFFDVARNLFVFGDALRNTIQFWAKQTGRNPVLVHRGQQLVYGARSADMNGDGKGFFYRDPETGQEVFHVPGSGLLTRALGLGGGGFNASVAGLNLATTSVIPGLAPGLSLLASAILPEREEFDGVRNLLFPYGDPVRAGASQVILPAWAQKVWIGLGHGDRGAFATSTVDTVRYLVSTGDYDVFSADPDTKATELDRLRADAVQKAKGLYILRGIVQFSTPSAPRPAAEVVDKDGRLVRAYLMAQDYQRMQRDPAIGFEKADRAFIEKYGELAFIVSEAKTESLGTAPANQEALDFARRHPVTVRRYRSVYGLFVSPGGEFNFDAYNRQLDTGERRRRTADEVLTEYRQDLARYVYDRAKTRLGDAATSPEGRTELAQLREKLAETFGDPKSYDPDKHRNLVRQLREALGDPALAKTDAGRALDTYLQARDMVAREAARRGVTNWDRAKKAGDLRQKLNAFGQQLLAANPAFGPMWDRVFERETD